MEWVKKAKIGDNVVCIKKGGWLRVNPDGEDDTDRKPLYGEICTISKIVCDETGIYLSFEGFQPFAIFRCERFRPIQTRPTNISVFTQLLNNVPADLVEA